MMKRSIERLSRQMVLILAGITLGFPFSTVAQVTNRIPYNDQELFLSGGNVAWVNFARDIGPGTTDLAKFEQVFSELHSSGGNSMRLWLHTTGAASPAWNGDFVTGPGIGTIDDLESILDLAWQNEIGLMLCLWSFDMLRISNGDTVTDRAFSLLTDSSRTQLYIDNALIPMVDSLKGHPGILSWEIFNEPEGMSNEFGWAFNRHVAMNDIQRFINMTAGAIHRTDPEALVTNGSWAFLASSDETPTAPLGKAADALSDVEVAELRSQLSARYSHEFSDVEAKGLYASLRSRVNINYYTDERLVVAGGDSLGILDFYTVHYYEWAGTALSPFHHNASEWGLDKPLAIAEFFMGGGDDGDPDATFGVSYDQMYRNLLLGGYAGALAWQWFNYPNGSEGVVNWPRILESTQLLFDQFRSTVDVDPGLRIVQFRASPSGIEEGETSELFWETSSADVVLLDGNPVETTGTLTIMPLVTSTYVLDAIDSAEQDTVSLQVIVEVLDPNRINRARLGAAFASSVETCCGNESGANRAFDGDSDTRWSSEWEEGLADSDPGDEWIYVDLGEAIAIDQVVLSWETAFGSEYNIDVSWDAQTWTTVFEERAGVGEIDTVIFETPPSGRFVRMRGLARGTEFGFSLWEFEVFGLVSELQPPIADITLPGDGLVFAPGNNVTITATASDPDGSIVQAEFLMDGTSLAIVTSEPWSVSWSDIPAGEFELSVVVTDDDGIAIRSQSIPAYVFENRSFVRHEAEAAVFSGQVTDESTGAASGGSFLDMRDDGSIIFDGVTVSDAGEYWLVLRYNLQYDVPKFQYIVVNGDTLPETQFSGNGETWLRRAVRASLNAGLNEIEIASSWGWMYFDYLEISVDVVNVAVSEQASSFATQLNPVFPNPATNIISINYGLSSTEHVRLQVFDITGRQISVVVDHVEAAGQYAVRFETASLANGVYFYRLIAGDFVGAKQFVVMR